VRAGSDIVFLGALIKYVLDRHDDMLRLMKGRQPSERERFFHDYLVHYTNAASLIHEEFKDTEDLGGVFSGLEDGAYNPKSWGYQSRTGDQPGKEPKGEGRAQSFSDQVGRLVKPAAQQDPTLQNEHCVFRILYRHFSRYTPEMVEQVCGTPRDVFLRVAQTLYQNAGPDRSGTIVYAVGWTQHSTGVQMIRTAAVLQLLLGSIGRPGGGILALRGHATIQGSTDIATLYNIHPGYLNTPSALQSHDTLRDYINVETNATSYWSNLPAFLVSQLKAWFGEAATAENDYAYDFLPKIVGDHSHIPIFVEMEKGNIKGFFALGQNPAVGGQHASFQRQALAKLDWLVVRDLFETETASFWKDSPEVKDGTLKTEEIGTEVFFLPAAAVAEGEGSPARRADAGALLTDGITGRECRLSQTAEQPLRAVLEGEGQRAGAGRLCGVSACPFYLPADGAPPQRGDEPVAGVAGGIDAGVVLRIVTRACRGDRRAEHRLGADQHAAGGDPRQGAGDAKDTAVPPGRRAVGTSRRPAVALGVQGADDGGRGEQPVGAGGGSERVDT
jgi:formate dehydrogenase major subunit